MKQPPFDALDADEQALLEDYEASDWPSQLTEARRARLVAMAEDTLRKSERINIRISRGDLQALQRRAAEEGMPYQTLVASVLHRYVSGTLVDPRAATGDGEQDD